MKCCQMCLIQKDTNPVFNKSGKYQSTIPVYLCRDCEHYFRTAERAVLDFADLVIKNAENK